MGPAYTYSAKVVRVVDGDTVDLAVDVGFRVTVNDRFRLLGINAPESRGVNADVYAATASTEHLRRMLGMLGGGTVVLRSHVPRIGQDKYGRWLAELWIDDMSVNRAMVDAGHAVEYDISWPPTPNPCL